MALYRPDPWEQEEVVNQNHTNHVINDPLAVIYNESQWRLNSVSPLYNLAYNSVKLKQYSIKIRQALVSTVAANASINFTVQCEAQPALKYSEDDADGLMITVSTTHDNNKTKVSYTGILLSWGQASKLPGAVHLPYLLERGEQRAGNAVRSTLQTVFDCNIKQYTFTQYQLLQFGFHFVDSDTSRSKDPFTLIYTTPQVEHKEKLKLSFEIGDIHVIWNGAKEEVESKSELVHLAYQILQNQIFYMTVLDITMFDLCEIILPKAEVKNNGTVKMKTPESINTVLTLLNEIANMHSYTDLEK